MKTTKKMAYSKPTVSIATIGLENTLASSSATVSPGDDINPNNPVIEDWQNGGTGYESIDL